MSIHKTLAALLLAASPFAFGQVLRPPTVTPSTPLTPNRTVITDANGQLSTASGTTSNCVKVDGTNGSCGGGGGGGGTGTVQNQVTNKVTVGGADSATVDTSGCSVSGASKDTLSCASITAGDTSRSGAIDLRAKTSLKYYTIDAPDNGAAQLLRLPVSTPITTGMGLRIASGSTGTVTYADGSSDTGVTIVQLEWYMPQTLSFTSPLTDNLGIIGIQQANGSQHGYLSSGDWNFFSGKATAGGCPANQVAIGTLVGGTSCIGLTTAYLPAAVVLTTNSYSDPSWLTGVDWSKILNKPSTFAPSSHSHSAADIVSGTLDDARLSANVALKNGSNSYTGTQDASGATRTAPNKVGTSLPATCTIGDTFFDSDAPAGQNQYGCTAANTWTLQGDGGGGGGVPTSRAINTSSPLSGGGDLTADRTIACATCEVTTNKGAANGYASLDANGLLPSSQTRQQASNIAFFGDGGDGDFTCTSSTHTSGPLTSGALTRDAFWNNLTLNAGCSINTAGYRIFVLGTLDRTNAPSNAITRTTVNGSAATSSTGGSAASVATGSTVGGSAGNSHSGGNGGTTTGTQAGTNNGGATNGGGSGAGGAGGTGASGAGGASRAGLSPTTVTPLRYWTSNLLRGVTLITGGASGSGGSGGGGDGTNSGGGGGGGAPGTGVLFLSAKVIVNGATCNPGFVSVKGGTGGAGRTQSTGNVGGGGGGGGAGGGWIYLVYGTVSGSPCADAIDASGGDGGAGGNGVGTGTAGAGGTGGNGGRITLLNLGAGTGSDTITGTGAAGSGATGGAGGANKVAL